MRAVNQPGEVTPHLCSLDHQKRRRTSFTRSVPPAAQRAQVRGKRREVAACPVIVMAQEERVQIVTGQQVQKQGGYLLQAAKIFRHIKFSSPLLFGSGMRENHNTSDANKMLNNDVIYQLIAIPYRCLILIPQFGLWRQRLQMATGVRGAPWPFASRSKAIRKFPGPIS